MSMIQISEFQNIAAALPPQRVYIAGGDREEDISLYACLRRKPFVSQCLLVGDANGMQEAAGRLGVALDPADTVGTGSQEETAATIMEMAKRGQVGVIQKGNISTPILNRQLVKLRTRDTMSLVTVFQANCIADGRPMIMTDAGVSASLNYSRMTALINNAAGIARGVLQLGHPRIALLSGNEKVIPALPSTGMAEQLTAAHWEDCTVYGPLSFDLAVDPESVRLKLHDLAEGSPIREVAGRADILVNPGLDAANIMYKMLMRLVETNSASMASVTAGIEVPYVISSRSDPERTKIDSVALACIYAHYLQQQKRLKVTKEAGLPGPRTFNILAIDPGPAATKLALYRNRTCLHDFELPHPHRAGLRGEAMDAEVERYVRQIRELLNRHPETSPDAIVGRGGFLNREGQRIGSGVYRVSGVTDGRCVPEADIISAVRDYAELDHVSNLGIPIAARLAGEFCVPAFAVDPAVVDEFQDEARFSGYAPVVPKNAGHVLSIRAAARKAAESIGMPFEKAGFVVAHHGDGVSIAAVKHGRIVDYTMALLDEDSVQKVGERVAAGDLPAEPAINAMVYRISKDIGAMTVALGSAVNAIVLTGGIARSELVAGKLGKRVGNLAPVIVFKQDLEMEAMAAGALRVLLGQETPLQYRLSPTVRDRPIGAP